MKLAPLRLSMFWLVLIILVIAFWPAFTFLVKNKSTDLPVFNVVVLFVSPFQRSSRNFFIERIILTTTVSEQFFKK